MAQENLGLDLPLFQAPEIKETKSAKTDNTEGQSDNVREKGDNDRDARESNTRTRKTRDRKRANNRGGDEKAGDNDTNDSAHNKSEGESDNQKEGSPRKRVRDRNGGARERNKQGGSSSNKNTKGSTKNDAPLTSTRVDSKKRRKDGREIQRRRNIITEADFLAKREDVDRKMVIREKDGSSQISILEDKVLVEHYVSEQSEASVVGNIYLGRVQNVLPGMEAAFVDIGVGRNGVLYAGEVNWDESGLVDGEPKRIEQALKRGDNVLVQVTKDPIGQKGARLTSQVTLAGRFLVLVPSSGIAGISKKLSDRERSRLKKIVNENITEDFGIIIRTSAQGASEEDIVADIERLKKRWEKVEKLASKGKAPAELYGESDMFRRVIRETFNDDFNELIISGDKEAVADIESYAKEITSDLDDRITIWSNPKKDVFDEFRINEQLAKSFDRKVWLPSGGTLVIDRTEAMTVIDINTGKFTGSETSSLEETVTQNNLEAAEEIVRQLRLRDIGGIVVIDFIDMILDTNRELVLRRLIECLMRDRTKHQVAEVTSLGLVQLTRKRVGQGLIEAFSTVCDHCNGKGYIVHDKPVEKDINSMVVQDFSEGWDDNFHGASHELEDGSKIAEIDNIDEEKREENRKRMAAMAASLTAGTTSNSDDDNDDANGKSDADDKNAEIDESTDVSTDNE